MICVEHAAHKRDCINVERIATRRARALWPGHSATHARMHIDMRAQPHLRQDLSRVREQRVRAVGARRHVRQRQHAHVVGRHGEPRERCRAVRARCEGEGRGECDAHNTYRT